MADAYDKANHNPVPVLNGDTTKQVLALRAKVGETVRLSAAGSTDPDGNRVNLTWFVYPEAGACRAEVKLGAADGERTSFVAPPVKQPETVHVILQARDDGAPSLFAYRRAVVTVEP